MRMGLLKKPIVIKGSPSTTRSYMYPTDLTVWLLNILVNPSLVPTNVGSTHSVTMSEIALTISKLFGTKVIMNESSIIPPTHYVPNCENSREGRKLSEEVSFEQGLIRWKNWLEG
jgi:dTDP-glucose 4,6-dehydratase